MIRSIRWVLSACLVVAGTSAFAGEEGGQSPFPKETGKQDPLVRKRDAKLAEAWLTKAPWFTDYDKAREEAKASGKPIFAYFTRSYAG
jgi:hypothetical protein